MNLWLIFLTGLTTGGLTCLAIQGGLLATAMTRQVAVDAPDSFPQSKSARRRARQHPEQAHHKTVTGVQIAQNPLPVLYFLVAKLVAYTVLGFLIGWLGSAVQINSQVQGMIQIGVGVFMLITALNMLNVHPIFRYFVIQPPKFLTKLVRNQAKSQDVFAPVLLGLMTVFIPCGTTQVMEALAMTSRSPLWGALIMFAFILGTSPTFFVLGFVASQLRGKTKLVFTYAAVILIIFLGAASIDGGMNVLGSPYAPSRMVTRLLNPRSGIDTSSLPTRAQNINGVQELTISVLNNAYAPNYLSAESGKPLRIKLVTDNTYGCTRSFTIPEFGIRKLLPDSGETVIDLPSVQKGEIFFTCGMGMYSGIISII